MLEKLIFSLLACSLFIVIFFKIIRKNDANYMILLVLQAIGIAINFIEIHLKIDENVFWGTIRYVFAIIIPLAIIIMELRGFNFSELLSVLAAKFFMMIGDTKTAKAILRKAIRRRGQHNDKRC